jgi:hypothetical protein
MLTPKIALEQLQLRTGFLESEIAGMSAVLVEIGAKIGRLHLVEVEYAKSQREAELAWVRLLMEDLRTGKLTWSSQGACQAASKDVS